METRPCPRCRAQTLTGTENARACALPYRLDPAPLAGALDELLALRAGRHTWTLHTSSGHVRLRSPAVITQWPAARTPHQQVHADHVCARDAP